MAPARHFFPTFLAAGLLGLLAAGGLAAQDALPRSPRNANYRIEVALDPTAKTLTGRETISWRNIQTLPTSEIWLHLYWNGWRNNRSTWMLEDRLRQRSDRGDEIGEGDWSYLEIDSLSLVGEGGVSYDLRTSLSFESPDDGNPDDRTVVRVVLPAPVLPGASVELEVGFRAKVPRTFARTGFRGNFFFVAHWYPSVGVYQADGTWSCHQFHAATEFYSDYGMYDVSITTPADFVLGASGRLVERTDNSDGTATRRHVAADIHNFAWTASPSYLEETRRFERTGLPPVEMRLLYQPEHLRQVDRHFAATEAALEYYGTWYGPYPYGQVTVIDPAYGSGAGGMEYPTLFTAGSRLWNPPGGGSPEGVTVHEAGHQFWYGIVGNDEFTHAWLDEGLNTFSTARTMDVAFGESSYTKRYLAFPARSKDGGARSGRRGGFLPLLFPELKESRMVGGNRLDGYRGAATSDAQATPTYRYFPATASNITYSKTALWLSTLERHLGWETVQRILATFFERYSFRHPTAEDFFAVANEVSGQDLGWFFDQVYRSSDSFDYAVQSVWSKPLAVEGWVQDGDAFVLRPPSEDESPTSYRTEVVVRRNGGARFPVDVLLRFEDGSEARHSWDGQDRWKLFVEEREAKLEYASVDPERVLLLDLHPTNNSRLREPKAKLPARKWASKWTIWLQDFFQTFTFFV